MNDPIQPQQQAGNDGSDAALLVYILYFAGFFFAITALAGVIVAYVKREEVSDMVRSHLTFLIKTFWVGVVAIPLSFLLAFILIGFATGILWAVWTLVRCITGILKLNDKKPVSNPSGWGFVA